MSAPFISPAKDGWEPSVYVIRYLQAKARKLGFFADWPIVCVLESHDLLLDCEPWTGEFGADLIAKKRRGRWRIEVEP